MLDKLASLLKLPSVKVTGISIGTLIGITLVFNKGCGCSPEPNPDPVPPTPSATPSSSPPPIGIGWKIACKSTEHLDVCVQFTDSDHQWIIGNSNNVEIGSQKKPVDSLFSGIQKGKSPLNEAVVVGLASSEGTLPLNAQRLLALNRANVLNNAYQKYMPSTFLYRGSIGQRQSRSEYPNFERSVIVLQFKRTKAFPETELSSKIIQALDIICDEQKNLPIDPSQYSDYKSFSLQKSIPVNQ